MVPDMCVFQVAEVPMNGYIYVTDKLQIDFDEDILQMLLGRIKSPFISNPCVFQSVPNKEDQSRVKLFYSDVLNSKC